MMKAAVVSDFAKPLEEKRARRSSALKGSVTDSAQSEPEREAPHERSAPL
jgi:hypothetical protein